MKLTPDLVPAEHEHGKKSGFEEEREDSFAASAEPKTSPTNREYTAQFVPN
jgi:hypothetical protein